MNDELLIWSNFAAKKKKEKSMMIYQLYVCGVEYKDYFYRIVGSYWHKEKAEEVKLKMEAEEKTKRTSRKMQHGGNA